MRTRLPIALVCLLLVVPCLAGEISGHVFLDANNDGQWQATDQPCAGVLVTDGSSVVATAADGRYKLQAGAGRQVVSVENPPQTWPTQGFWRSFKDGAGTADFPLRAAEQKLPFTFVQGTDLHTRPGSAEGMARYVKTINELPLPLAFVVHTGDLVVDSGGETPGPARVLFEGYKSQVAGLKPPLFNLPGNHEHVSWYRESFDANDPDVGTGLYRELFGPLEYAFNYGGVHFLALDGTDYLKGRLEYSMPPACVQWLRTYLARLPAGDRLVLLCHEPLFSLPQKAELEQILAGRTVVVSLSGHWHSTSRSTFAGAPEILGGCTSYPWHGYQTTFDAIGFQLVRVTADGFESAFGDYTDAYPVTVAEPTLYAALTGQAPVKAQVLDLKGEVAGAQFELGGVKQTVAPLAAEGLYRTAATSLDVSSLPEGYYELAITLQGAGAPQVEKQPRLVRSGKAAEFTATGPAKLTMVLKKVNAANLIKVNGEQVATTPADAKDGQVFTVEVPARLLRRLNCLEFVSVLLADGTTYDNFSAEKVALEYGGKTYRDPRTAAGGSANLNGKEPTTWPLWVDLCYGGK